ncbi:pyrroline-5-carboxylate reductase [Corallococcus carmarthensis]|uniref:Pyrroline-5-carboxylate reductase n=1 Tax=Corallococcus carmarthensis TaxID=2316728 RepID=A0A3A8JVQ0_9BACT|nr:pyrroline-5-carboxylate reductase [Corallococcus carmarthensis]NOK18687.1 pyrroline-5-carboxylate reductase [Corallococcus carmarthensis]RKG99018.1 pyrroline-5-carboxylate reductase [Corallococcus carmarthensis]
MTSHPIPAPVVLLGGGKIAEALIQGLLRSGQARPSDLRVTVRRPERGEELRSRHGVQVLVDNAQAVRGAGVVLLAVRQAQLRDLMAVISPALAPGQTVVSLSADVRLEQLEAALPSHVSVFRAMPHTPVRVGSGVTPLTAGTRVTEAAKRATESVFAATGQPLWMSEEALTVCTGVSCTGPAYVFRFVEALAQAAMAHGMDAAEAAELARGTLIGAAKLLAEPAATTPRLIAEIATPGGITMAGLEALEANGLPRVVGEAVTVAIQRTRERADANAVAYSTPK